MFLSKNNILCLESVNFSSVLNNFCANFVLFLQLTPLPPGCSPAVCTSAPLLAAVRRPAFIKRRPPRGPERCPPGVCCLVYYNTFSTRPQPVPFPWQNVSWISAVSGLSLSNSCQVNKISIFHLPLLMDYDGIKAVFLGGAQFFPQLRAP